jgi:hypothetical protein
MSPPPCAGLPCEGQPLEARLWVLPAATGQGERLFTDLAHPLPLRLETSKAFPSGILELVYAPANG